MKNFTNYFVIWGQVAKGFDDTSLSILYQGIPKGYDTWSIYRDSLLTGAVQVSSILIHFILKILGNLFESLTAGKATRQGTYRTLSCCFMCTLRDSNPWPSRCKRDALTN